MSTPTPPPGSTPPKQYDAMPPPRKEGKPETAPLTSSPPNAWIKGKVSTEDKASRLSGEKFKAIDPEAQAKAQASNSLRGRVSAVLDYIGTKLSAIGSAIKSLFVSKPPEEKDEITYHTEKDDAYVVSDEELDKLSEAAESASAKLDDFKSTTKGKVDKLVFDAANKNVFLQAMIRSNNELPPNKQVSELGSYFSDDKENFDSAAKKFYDNISNAKSTEEVDNLLNAVIEGKNRLDQTYQMEITRK